MKLINISLFLVLSLFITLQLFSQSFQWANSFGGTAADRVYSVKVDDQGNVYTTGSFNDSVDFDPGPGTFTLVSNGADDVFIQKVDASGNFLWAKSFGGNLLDIGQSIAIDELGNVYTTGAFRGTVDFDPGAGVFNLTTNFNGGVFVQKLDSLGNFIWARSFGGSSLGSSICLDDSSNVYTLGIFNNSVDFDPGSTVFNLSSQGRSDVFVQKMDSAGNFRWARSWGGSNTDNGYSMSLDAFGNIYTSGTFTDTIDIDPGTANTQLISNGSTDIFVQKMDRSGNFIWGKAFGGISIDEGKSIITNSKGDSYVTGLFSQTVDFDPGPGTQNLSSSGGWDTYVLKLNSAGNFVWARSFISSSTNDARGIGIDNDGNVYTTGRFFGTVDFDPSTTNASVSSNGVSDLYIHKLDSFGNFSWVQSIGGTSFEAGDAICIDQNENVYIGGAFFFTVDFDPGNGVNNLSAVGRDDIFVLKLSQNISTDLNDQGNEIKVSIYPNPTKDIIKLRFDESLSQMEIRLFNAEGKLISSIGKAEGGKEQIEINGAPGIYFLNLSTPNSKRIIKVIKE